MWYNKGYVAVKTKKRVILGMGGVCVVLSGTSIIAPEWVMWLLVATLVGSLIGIGLKMLADDRKRRYPPSEEVMIAEFIDAAERFANNPRNKS